LPCFNAPRLTAPTNINQPEAINLLLRMRWNYPGGGARASERAKQAKALMLLLEGISDEPRRIHTVNSATYSMEQFNFQTRGMPSRSNSAEAN